MFVSQVAIKRLHAHNLTHDALEQFKTEIAIMQRLRSNQVINIFGACVEEGKYCLVTFRCVDDPIASRVGD